MSTRKFLIEGPVTFAEYYHPILKKHVYLFGDIHTSEIRCPQDSTMRSRMPFDSLVKKMIRSKTSTSKIDVFVESSFLTADRPEKQEPDDFVLSSFRKTFSPVCDIPRRDANVYIPTPDFIIPTFEISSLAISSPPSTRSTFPIRFSSGFFVIITRISQTSFTTRTIVRRRLWS